MRGCLSRVVRGRPPPPPQAGRVGAQPCPCSAARLRREGGKRFPRLPPRVYLFSRRSGEISSRFICTEDAEASGRRSFIFYGRSLWGRPRPSFSCTTGTSSPPPRGYQPRDALASGWGRSRPQRVPCPGQPRGARYRGEKRPRKETFPSMIVLPLAERVMKILGKCYTTRGYPFGAKFPEKPGRFPGAGGDAGGAVISREAQAHPPRSRSPLPPFPGRPPPKREPENNITCLRAQTSLSPLQCYKKSI